jgi:hypothetical protein
VQNRKAVHLYVKKIDETAGRGGGIGTIAELMERLSSATGTSFVDQTGHKLRNNVEWRNHDEDLAAKDPAAMAILLENITKQTGLTFSRETLEVEMFIVREEGK